MEKGLFKTLLLVSALLLPSFTYGKLNLEHYCFGPPYGEKDVDEYHKTVGTELLNWGGFNESTPSTTSKFVVKVYLVKMKIKENPPDDYTDLTGWFHLKITLEPPVAAAIDRLVINARGFMNKGFKGQKSGWVSGVGDFLPAMQNCIDEPLGAKEYSNSWDRDIEFVPCGGVSAFDPVLGGGYVKSHGVLSNSQLKEFHLNFRLASTVVNFYSKVNFRVHGFAGDQLYGTVSSDTIVFDNKHLEGAADPPPDTDFKIACHVEKAEGDLFHGIKEIQRATLNLADALVDFSCLPADASALTAPFSGRCSNEWSPADGAAGRRDGSTDRLQLPPEESDLDPEFYNSLTTYDAEILEIHHRIDTVCANHETAKKKFECPTLPPRPDRPASEGAPQRTTPKPGTKPKPKEDKRSSKRKAAECALGEVYIPGVNVFIWDARVVHGVFMSFLTFFVLPVNAVTTRYFKETWKNKSIYGHNVWYFMHHFWSGIIIILYVGGLGRVVKSRGIIGHSLVTSALVHRLTGWISIGLTGLLIALGGLRCQPRGLRALFIALHFLIGTTIYLVSLSEVVSSSLIPGSPANADSGIIYKEFNIITTLVIVRVVVDIAFNVIFSVLLFFTDKKANVTRRRFYLPSPMPVIKDSESLDMPGGMIRNIVLVFYVIISAILAIVACVLLVTAGIYRGKDGKGLVGMGPMSCTHKTTTSFLAEYDATCS